MTGPIIGPATPALWNPLELALLLVPGILGGLAVVVITLATSCPIKSNQIHHQTTTIGHTGFLVCGLQLGMDGDRLFHLAARQEGVWLNFVLNVLR